MAKRTFDFKNLSFSEIADGVSTFLSTKYRMDLIAKKTFDNEIMITSCDQDKHYCCTVRFCRMDPHSVQVEVSDLKILDGSLKDVALSVLLTLVNPWIGMPYAGLSILDLNNRLQIPNSLFCYLEGLLSCDPGITSITA